MKRKLVTPSPNTRRPLFSKRQQVQRLQKDDALAEAAAYKVKARGSSTWTTSDLQTVLRNIVESSTHNVDASLKDFNRLIPETNSSARIPGSTVHEWYRKVKPFMAQRKNYLGVYDHSKALTFIEDNVKRNGKAGDNKRVLTDVEEEYLAEVISFCFDRGLGLGDRNVIKIANDVQKAKGKDQDRVPVSSKWYDGFRKRHPEIQYKKSTNIDYNRVEAASRLKIHKHVRSRNCAKFVLPGTGRLP